MCPVGMSAPHLRYAAVLLLLAGGLTACGQAGVGSDPSSPVGSTGVPVPTSTSAQTSTGGATSSPSVPPPTPTTVPALPPTPTIPPEPTGPFLSDPVKPPSTGTGGPGTPPVTVPAGGRVIVTGVPQEGVEASCLLLQSYLLIGGTEAQRALLSAGSRAGTTVIVTGHPDPNVMSYCQQGTVLVVDEVRAGP